MKDNDIDNGLDIPGFTKEEINEALESLVKKGILEKTQEGKYKLTFFGKAIRDVKSKQLNGEEVILN